MTDIKDLPQDWDSATFTKNTNDELTELLKFLISKTKLGEITWRKVAPTIDGFIKPCTLNENIYECMFGDSTILIEFLGFSRTSYKGRITLTDSISASHIYIEYNELFAVLHSIIHDFDKESFNFIHLFLKNLQQIKGDNNA